MTTYYNYPVFLLNDFRQCRKRDNNWEFDIRARFGTQQLCETISFEKVCIKGFIEQKPCDDVMILKDCSGRVKLSNCSSAIAEDCDTIVKGVLCVVDGTLVRQTGLPEVSAHKIIKIVNDKVPPELLFKYWQDEVNDFKLFALGMLKPNL